MSEYRYIHTHGDQQYCLVYETGWAFIVDRQGRDGRCSWTATLEEAWNVTGLDLDDPAQEEHWKAVRLEDLPSRPAEQDVLDQEASDDWGNS